MCCKLLISFLLTVFVKLLSSTCDILQLPLHVAPLLNFVRRNTRVTCRKKSSYPSILPVAKAELFSGVNWLSVYLMNSERCSTSISPVANSGWAPTRAPVQIKVRTARHQFCHSVLFWRDARQQHSTALFCCLVPCIITPLVYTSSNCFPKGDMGSQVTMQRRTLITVN